MTKGKIIITKDLCKGCELCISACRFGVIRLSSPDKVNKSGYRYLEAYNPEACTGCGMCARMCPDSVLAVWRESSGTN